MSVIDHVLALADRDKLAANALWMQRTVRLGVKALWLHRLRSLLTMLGIVFGVCSVIAMLAIGEGASYEAQQQIRSLGSNNVILKSVKPPEPEGTSQSSSSMTEYGLTYNDIARIRGTIPGVTIVVPARIIRKDVWYRSLRVDADIHGTVPWYPEMRNHRVAEGRFFTDIEMDAKQNVCVLGYEMDRQLFPYGGAVGKTIRAGGVYYRVVGVMERRGSSEAGSSAATAAQNQNADAAKSSEYIMYVPLTTARERFGETIIRRTSQTFTAETVELHEVTAKVHNIDNVIETSAIIRQTLESTHKVQDFDIVVPLQLLQQAERTKRIFNIVLGAIAGISLVVGGIGIMNIMLASVTERTREIGIRRALGAKKRDIVVQFLVETVLLSGTGGIIGVIIGVSIPFFITLFAEMQTIVTLWAPLVAFSISGIVGIVFGIYPAIRAANMDPVEALRHE